MVKWTIITLLFSETSVVELLGRSIVPTVDHHRPVQVGAAVLGSLPYPVDSEGGQEATYEEMVAKRVQEFIQQTQQVVQSSALQKVRICTSATLHLCT